MRVGIVGTGGIGGLIGGFLAKHGIDVALLARGAHLEALRQRGLRFEGQVDTFSVDTFSASDQGSELGACDVLFVAVKTFHLDSAIPHIRAMMGKNTVVVPLLNGVIVWDFLAGKLGGDLLVGGSIYVNSWVASPGVIKQIGSLVRLVMGERSGGTSPRLHAINDLLISAGIAGELEPNIVQRSWYKFLGFEPMALVGALSRSTIGAFRQEEGTRSLLIALMEEVATIAKRKGVDLGDDAIKRRMDIIDGLAYEATISMQRDLMSGRISEFMEQSVELLSMAKSLGVATPVHDICVPLLQMQETAARASREKAR